MAQYFELPQARKIHPMPLISSIPFVGKFFREGSLITVTPHYAALPYIAFYFHLPKNLPRTWGFPALHRTKKEDLNSLHLGGQSLTLFTRFQFKEKSMYYFQLINFKRWQLKYFNKYVII